MLAHKLTPSSLQQGMPVPNQLLGTLLEWLRRNGMVLIRIVSLIYLVGFCFPLLWMRKSSRKCLQQAWM